MAFDNAYYKLPFSPTALFAEEEMPACGLAESIAQNLMLLITTKPGENRYDEEFGNAVWNIEFENTTTEAMWEDTFKQSLNIAISKYEHRIYSPRIFVKTVSLEQNYKMKNFTEIKKKATIQIKAKLTESGENYNFSTELFLSPMSID